MSGAVDFKRLLELLVLTLLLGSILDFRVDAHCRSILLKANVFKGIGDILAFAHPLLMQLITKLVTGPVWQIQRSARDH